MYVLDDRQWWATHWCWELDGLVLNYKLLHHQVIETAYLCHTFFVHAKSTEKDQRHPCETYAESQINKCYLIAAPLHDQLLLDNFSDHHQLVFTLSHIPLVHIKQLGSCSLKLNKLERSKCCAGQRAQTKEWLCKSLSTACCFARLGRFLFLVDDRMY